METKTCPKCGKGFACTADGTCWCAMGEPAPIQNPEEGCRCPSCLEVPA